MLHRSLADSVFEKFTRAKEIEKERIKRESEHELELFKLKIEATYKAEVAEQRRLSDLHAKKLERELEEVKEAHRQHLAKLKMQERASIEFNDVESVEKKLEQLGGVPESKM